MDVQKTIDKIKDLIRKGNVSRIVIRRKDKEILNLPVNVAAVGAVVGLAAAKWAVLAAALATVGFGCTVEVVKTDGAVVNVLDDEKNQKVRNFATDAVEKVKENIPVSINLEVKRDPDKDFADVVDAHSEEVLDPVEVQPKDEPKD